jgi:hypothetical protein
MVDGNYDGNVPVSSFSNNIGRALLRAIRIKSSKTELLHLFVATLLVTGVGLSFNHYRHISWQFLTIFISAFLVHELAHKLLAQYYVSWAEFRTELELITYGSSAASDSCVFIRLLSLYFVFRGPVLNL